MSLGTIDQIGFDASRALKSLQVSLNRLSSGKRVSMAAHDAAGLGYATNLETATSSTRMAMRNHLNAIALTDTLDAAAGTVTDMLQRMRELAVQSANGVLDDTQRSFLNDEFLGLRSEIGRVAQSTKFNEIQLANGSVNALSVQVGKDQGDNHKVDLELADLTVSGLGLSALSFTVGTEGEARGVLDTLDVALGSVNSVRSVLGATINRLEASFRFEETYTAALTAAEATILDADIAMEAVVLARGQLQVQASAAALVQARQLHEGIFRLLA
jgi:flagellin